MVLSGHRVALVGHYCIWWPFHHHAVLPPGSSVDEFMYLYKYMRPPDYPLSSFTQLDREKGQTVHHWQCCLSNLKRLQIGWGRLLVALQVLQPPVYTRYKYPEIIYSRKPLELPQNIVVFSGCFAPSTRFWACWSLLCCATENKTFIAQCSSLSIIMPIIQVTMRWSIKMIIVVYLILI